MCKPYLDDIIVTGKDNAKNSANIEAVLMRLEDNAIKLKKGKMRVSKGVSATLGHHINKAGIQPVEHKVQAI